MAAISEISVGMGVFSANQTRIGTVDSIAEDRVTILGASGSGYEGGHYQAATVLIASVHEGRVVLSNDAEAALILEEAYSEVGSGRGSAGNKSLRAARGSSADPSTAYSRSGPSNAAVVGFVLVWVVVVTAIPFLFGRRKRTETRPQRAGEAATTRFGMEGGDSTDIPATGGPGSWES